MTVLISRQTQILCDLGSCVLWPIMGYLPSDSSLRAPTWPGILCPTMSWVWIGWRVSVCAVRVAAADAALFCKGAPLPIISSTVSLDYMRRSAIWIGRYSQLKHQRQPQHDPLREWVLRERLSNVDVCKLIVDVSLALKRGTAKGDPTMNSLKHIV